MIDYKNSKVKEEFKVLDCVYFALCIILSIMIYIAY